MGRKDSDRTAWLLAEFGTLREESGHARQAQQSTLQWSLAGVAALFAAGLVFAAAVIKGSPSSPEIAALIGLFGVAIPGYAFASSLVYAGEIRRMERAGAYLRALEAEVEHIEGIATLRWERYLKVGDGVRGPAKLIAPYLGGAGLYAGSTAVSAAAYWAVMDQLVSNLSGRWVLDALACIWIVFVVAALWFIGLRVRRTDPPRLDGVSRQWRKKPS